MEWARMVGDVIRSDLKGTTKLVYLAVLAHTDPNTDICQATVPQLTLAASVSERSLWEGIADLRAAGVLRVDRPRRSTGVGLRAQVVNELPTLVTRTISTREAKAALPKPKVPKGKLKAYQELVELCTEPGCPLKAHVANLEAQQEEVSRESVSDMLF